MSRLKASWPCQYETRVISRLATSGTHGLFIVVSDKRKSMIVVASLALRESMKKTEYFEDLVRFGGDDFEKAFGNPSLSTTLQ